MQLAVRAGAASADHCTHLTDADVDALACGRTVATLLPGVEFSTRQPYPDARRLLGAGRHGRAGQRLQPGVVLHLQHGAVRRTRGQGDADDHPGGGLVGHGGRRPARCAATDVGHLGEGARANVLMLDAPSHAYLAYRPGVPLAAAVWRAGELVAGSPPTRGPGFPPIFPNADGAGPSPDASRSGVRQRD